MDQQNKEHPDWTRLLDDDREEIGGHLQPGSMEVEPDSAVRSLCTVLVRRSAVPGLLQGLLVEVERRRPREPAPIGEERKAVEVPVEEILASTLVPSAVIRNAKDLEDWLAALRLRIAGILRGRKHVRIKGDE